VVPCSASNNKFFQAGRSERWPKEFLEGASTAEANCQLNLMSSKFVELKIQQAESSNLVVHVKFIERKA